jgi:acyl CoA:acetate/3-ketoacid CoA transferase
MSLSSGAYFGSHSALSQWTRAASVVSVALLTWIGLSQFVNPSSAPEH